MKNKTPILIGVLIAGTVYAIYLLSGADNVLGLWDWLQSLITRLSLSTNSLLESVMGTDPQTEAVSTALSFIANQEGFSGRAYPDPPGQVSKFSIAYGHQIVPGDGLSTTSILSESEGYDLLSSDTQKAVDDVFNDVTADGLTANQYAALISFRYNVGEGAESHSTLISLVNSGDIQGAADEFPKWIYANGQVSNALVKRRAAEQALFLS